MATLNLLLLNFVTYLKISVHFMCIIDDRKTLPLHNILCMSIEFIIFTTSPWKICVNEKMNAIKCISNKNLVRHWRKIISYLQLLICLVTSTITVKCLLILVYHWINGIAFSGWGYKKHWNFKKFSPRKELQPRKVNFLLKLNVYV